MSAAGRTRPELSGDRLQVQADLTIEVDGTTSHLSTDGDRLVLESSHPERVWASFLASALPAGVGDLNGPRAVGRVGDGLAEAGLRLEVTGPAGTVAHLGQGVNSRAGRVLTGSSAVGPGAPGAMAALVWHRSRVAVVAVAAAVGGAVVIATARRRRTRS